MIDRSLSHAAWFKSSYSIPEGDACVEVALNLPAAVAVRDSKNPSGPALTFSRSAWRKLTAKLDL
ncbi:DUF397 domain-containing protein [Actinocorallia sp. API 0066]|uniref:DUF397 domain-containing protein n=1 Tax=Actinocorallia sp. API 0066 TaxID=2896846 RepID=UPI001E2B9022|nr:DUF397 domain-containing protein [Actinocorallia sp. API 0066]MCD0453254.1 DUF397 domain-containing protein [Actinocorallia sp. API 0066]